MWAIQNWGYVSVSEIGLCLMRQKYGRCMQAAKIRFPKTLRVNIVCKIR